MAAATARKGTPGRKAAAAKPPPSKRAEPAKPAARRHAAAPVEDAGYEEPRTVVRLQFAAGSHPGLVVRVHLAPTDVLDALSELADVDPDKPLDAAARGRLRAAVTRLGEELLEWNLRRGGEPVPATPEAVRRLDLVFATELLAAWVQATDQVLQTRMAEVGEVDEADLPMDD